jgi:Cu-Zn family superoxide dismutase
MHQGGIGSANAVLRDAAGQTIGQARLTQASSGLRLSLRVNGLKPGTLGTHVHTVGRCDGPDFASAGSHWNPMARQHGRDNPAGMHKGDLPNMTVGSDGRGRLDAVIEGAALAELLDADGAAVVVHTGPDDYRTDPSGNSGARIACGVLVAS